MMKDSTAFKILLSIIIFLCLFCVYIAMLPLLSATSTTILNYDSGDIINITFCGNAPSVFSARLDNNPAIGSPPPCDSEAIDYTSNSSVNVSDNQYIYGTINVGNEGYTYFELNMSGIDINDVYNITPLIEWGRNISATSTLYAHIWNNTDSGWVIFSAWFSSASSDIQFTGTIEQSDDVTKFVNNDIISLIIADSSTSQRTTRTDYVQVSLDYNALGSVSLSQPIDYYNSSNNLVTFECNATGNYSINIDSTTIEVYNSTGIVYSNKTSGHASTSVNNVSTLNIQDGIYSWNCKVENVNGDIKYGTNRSLIVDTTGPDIQIIYPSNGFSVFMPVFIPFDLNFSVSDSGVGIVDSCWYQNHTDGINISVSCTGMGELYQSNYSTYSITFFANDSLGNENSLLSYYKLSQLDPNAGGGGVSGGGDIVIISSNKTWEMTTESRSKNYDLSMTKDTARSKDVLFFNNGSNEEILELSCQGELCQYVLLDSDTISVPVGLNIPTASSFTITLPDDITDGEYVFNIIAEDSKNQFDIVTVNVKIGSLGLLTEIGTKIFSSKEFFGIYVPYVALFLIGWTILSFLGILLLRNIPGGIPLSIILGMIINFILLIFY